MDISYSPSKRIEFDRVNQVTFIVNRWKKSTQRDLLVKIDNRGILPPVKRIKGIAHVCFLDFRFGFRWSLKRKSDRKILF